MENNITIKDLMKELNITVKELIALRNKAGIIHQKTVFTYEEAESIRKENNIIIEEIQRMSKDLNIIYYGPAGTGKTKSAIEEVKKITDEEYTTASKDYNEEIKEIEKNENLSKNAQKKQIKEIKSQEDYQAYPLVEFTTFHPSYQYQEFIEGISIEEKDGNTYYKVKDGIFKKIAKRAKQNKSKNYVLIIDEINRGNISSIFGEFFTLLEDTKRVFSTEEENSEAVSITLPYSQEKLSVPDNLYILGTMNTTDKSISLLDVALRRRFKFIAVEPDYDILKNIDGLDIAKVLESINKRLTVLKGEDFQIGHSYFLNVNSIEDLREIFEFKIIPLLKEYFHGDWESICAILNQNYQAIEDNGLLINKFNIDDNLFKNNTKFSEKIKKKQICILNLDFSIENLKTVI